jgi:hypothetical protein
VALKEGSLVVNSSQGGGSKDTWVLADDPRAGEDVPIAADSSTVPAAEPPSQSQSQSSTGAQS